VSLLPSEPALPWPCLPPTTEKLLDPATQPYFLWWDECTVSEFRKRIESPDDRVRGYWLGALLREANSRDVWLFTTPGLVRKDWEFVLPHLGKARAMWGWLLDMDATWPPKPSS
jgi:hypothetical protein